MFGRRPIRSSSVSSLDLHPNLAEILSILSRVPMLTDRDLTGLAAAWRDTGYLSTARDHALAPDSPLILDVLAAFERVDAVFNEELCGTWIDGSDGSDTAVKPKVIGVALKAVRDTLAAAYAKPTLTRSEYAALMMPWRRVFPADGTEQAAPSAQSAAVENLLAALAPLSGRCHDEPSRLLFSQLAQVAVERDVETTRAARETAWKSAVTSARRRQWALLRQTVQEALSRPCRTCRTWHRPIDESFEAHELVRSLCVDAVCGALMADTVEPEITKALVDPILPALPPQRTAGE